MPISDHLFPDLSQNPGVYPQQSFRKPVLRTRLPVRGGNQNLPNFSVTP